MASGLSLVTMKANRQTLVTIFFLLFAISLGAFLRLYPVLLADFPINDGGLFYEFTQELVENKFVPPVYSSYNSASIPFTYPPLSFYTAALLSTILGWNIIDVLRVLPAVISVLTIPACYLLARSILESKLQAIIASFSFALLPTAFDFLIVGGGLPRSFGFLFSILTLWQLILLYEHPRKWRIVLTIGFATLTVLSHPVVSWFTVYSALVVFLFFNRQLNGLINSCLIALGTLSLSSPWWIFVLGRYGPLPFVNATQLGFRSWNNIIAPILFIHTNEPFLPIHGFLGLLGLFVCLHSKHYFLPIWLGVVYLIEPRLVASYSVLPMVMLVAIGLDKIIISGLIRLENPDPVSNLWKSDIDSHREGKTRISTTKIPVAILGFFLIYALMSAYISSPKNSLPPEHREAMRWVSEHTPKVSHFLVIAGPEAAGWDISEWFPALTKRVSLGTPQGYEWLDGHEFSKRWNRQTDLQKCITQTTECLDNWAENSRSTFEYVYLTLNSGQGYPTVLIDSIVKSSHYKTIYKNSVVAIFQRIVP